MRNENSVHDLAHVRIHEIIQKAADVAKQAIAVPTLKGPSREKLRMKVKEHLGTAIEWIVAMDNIDRGY
jgi:hypothetical protein